MITPMKEIANSAEDMLPGIHARVIGNYIRRLNNAMLSERQRNHHPLLLHLNQWRMSIGVTFGDPRVLPGGRALEFSTSQQIEMYNTEHFSTDKDKSSGAPKLSKEEKAALKEQGVTANGEKLVMFNEHSFKITKDKTGGRIKDGRFKLIRDESMGLPVGYIDQSRSIVQHGLKRGVLSGAPNSFSHDDYRKWGGAGDFVKWLVENPEAERAIVGQIVETYRQAWGVM
jgi:RecA/RadA recombinase